MVNNPKIIAFSGALRKDSVNKKTVVTAALGAEKQGAIVKIIDLRDYPLPLYDGDLEAEFGLPENARVLQRLFIEHDGLLISSPEYNSGISGTLKTYIDWISRPCGDLGPGAAFRNKYASIMSASPGMLGGIRALPNLRTILSSMGVHVLAEDFALGFADKAFASDGTAKSVEVRKKLENLGSSLVSVLSKVKAPLESVF